LVSPNPTPKPDAWTTSPVLVSPGVVTAGRVLRVALHRGADATEVLGVDLDEGVVLFHHVGVADEGDLAEGRALAVAHGLADRVDAVRRGAHVGLAVALVDEVHRARACVGLVVGAGLQRRRTLGRGRSGREG
jgi:hypothetical protein